jgi:hypothetical protein
MKNKRLNKTLSAVLIAIGFPLLVFLGGCEEEKMEPKYDIYENHDISVCGVDDPLRNMDWLKEYCDSIKEDKDILFADIWLSKALNTEEYILKISITSFTYKEEFFNCNGDIIYEEDYKQSTMQAPVSRPPNTWFEMISEVFHYYVEY